MKVLFLTVRADLGGGPEHLNQLIAHRPEGVDAWVGCPNEAPYFDRYRAHLGPDRVFEIPHRAFKLSALRRLAQLIRANDIDIIHSHGKGAGLYGRLLALMTRARAVHTFHGLHVGEYGPAKKALYLAFERAMKWLTARGICVSRSEAGSIKAARLVFPDRLRLIENGVALPAAARRPALCAPLQILAVNRYDFQKDPDLMIDIARALQSKRAFEMTVLGTGARFEEMRQRVAAEGLEDIVHLKGGVPSVRPYMHQAHLFLSTSRWEGMPLAVLEAMSEGLVPVVTDVAGNNDIVAHDDTGLLFSGAADAAAQIAKLSPDRFERLSAAARGAVETHYSVQHMSERTYALLSEAMQEARPAPRRARKVRP